MKSKQIKDLPKTSYNDSGEVPFSLQGVTYKIKARDLAPVRSFHGRTGDITLESTEVSGAMAFHLDINSDPHPQYLKTVGGALTDLDNDKSNKLAAITDVTTETYTVQTSDLDKFITFSSSAVTACVITLPPASGYSDGFKARVWNQSPLVSEVTFSGTYLTPSGTKLTQYKDVLLMVRNINDSYKWFISTGLT